MRFSAFPCFFSLRHSPFEIESSCKGCPIFFLPPYNWENRFPPALPCFVLAQVAIGFLRRASRIFILKRIQATHYLPVTLVYWCFSSFFFFFYVSNNFKWVHFLIISRLFKRKKKRRARPTHVVGVHFITAYTLKCYITTRHL